MVYACNFAQFLYFWYKCSKIFINSKFSIYDKVHEVKANVINFIIFLFIEVYSQLLIFE